MTEHAAAGRVDTSDMNAVHTVFRREHRLAGDVVRRVADGDTERAAVVAEHIDFINTFLHDHHGSEDSYLWPLLRDRVPDDLAPVVHLMETQHEHVNQSVQQIYAVLPQWRKGASAADRDRIADLLDQLYASLAEHLTAEEDRLLPIAARALDQDEWDKLAELSIERLPKKHRPLVLGMVQYGADPATVAKMISQAPWPTRVIVPRLSRRVYSRYALSVYGTATP